MKKAAIIGWPVEHSLSPLIHGHWLKTYGIDGQYDRIAVPPEGLADHIARLKEPDLAGFNVTMPHKENILPLLDEVDDLARRIGAVNTVVNRDGRLLGSNSDAYGFLQNLKEVAAGAWDSTAPALLVGAGGAARAAVVALIDEGVPEVRITNRTVEKAESLAREFGSQVSVIPWNNRHDAVEGVSLVVNTTSLGMAGKPPLDLRLDRAGETCVVYDIVYKPAMTELLRLGNEQALKTVDGLGMLLHQAVPGFRAWFGGDPVVDNALVTKIREAAGC